MTGALGAVGGVIPGQAGTVVTDLSGSVGDAVGAGINGEYENMIVNATSGAS